MPYRDIQSYLPLPNPNYVTLLTINSEKKQEVNSLLTDFVFPERNFSHSESLVDKRKEDWKEIGEVRVCEGEADEAL